MPQHPLSLSRRSFLKAACLSTAGWLVGCNPTPRASASDPSTDTVMAISERWASSTNLNITLHSSAGPDQALTRSGNAFKPSWSTDGTRLTFFRAEKYGSDFKDWRSAIYVINADGTGLRQLTTTEFPNFNPTWARDGSNRILFNRFSPSGDGRNQVYWTSPDASPGDEQLTSDPDYAYFEWVNSGLRDGRIFVDRLSADGIFKSFLLTPLAGKPGKYEEIARPTDLYWHKLTLSPGETKVAYMLDHDNNIPTYNDSVICYAEFDINTLTIQRQVAVTQQNLRSIQEYPAWNNDDSVIVYDSNETGTYQVYAYRLADGVTTKLSPDRARNDQFAAFEGAPK